MPLLFSRSRLKLLVFTKVRNELKRPKTTYNYLKRAKTIYKAYTIKTTCSYNQGRTQNKWFLSQKSKQKRNKNKIGIFTVMSQCNIFAYTAFFCFPNHTVKLRAPEQPQVQGKKVF